MQEKRIAFLLACGLRRHEVAELTVITSRGGKAIGRSLTCAARAVTSGRFRFWTGLLRTQDMIDAAEIKSGKVLRRVSSAGKAWGDGVTEKLAWHVVKEFAAKTGVSNLAPHDLRRTLCPTLPRRWRRTGTDLNSSSGTCLFRRRSAISAVRSGSLRP
jgi:hypothetical protein